MRIDLGQLSAADLSLNLPADPSSNTPEKDVLISNAEALRGAFVTDASGWQLSNMTAARLLLAKLHWRFGKLSLVTEEDAALLQLTAEVKSADDDLVLDLGLGGLDAEKLHVATPSLRIAAQVEGRSLRVQSSETVGLMTAERAVFHGFEFEMSGLVVSAPELKVTQLVVDWGSDDFRLEVGTAEAASLTIRGHGTTLEGRDIALGALRLVGSQVRLGQFRAGRLDATAELAEPPEKSATATEELAAAVPAPVAKTSPTFDYELLNQLVGRLDVDVAVDVAVPIIGHRKATHKLRVPIDHGALNYRELEHNLAPLEDSLVDFSVRDGALVLELGLPLIKTRGHGKPLLVWDLGADDLALAEQERVRLAVLPNFHPAGDAKSEPAPEESGEKKDSSFKLRHLSFENIDAALRLPTSIAGAQGLLRDLTFANLTLRGTVHHDPDEPPRDGELDLELEGLRTTFGDIAVGDQHLKGRLELAALRQVHASFRDVRPLKVTAIAEGVALAEFELG